MLRDPAHRTWCRCLRGARPDRHTQAARPAARTARPAPSRAALQAVSGHPRARPSPARRRRAGSARVPRSGAGRPPRRRHGVLVADPATGGFRFRHALLAEAIYATILPGERQEQHGRLADELARSATAGRPNSRPTGRPQVAAQKRWPRRSKRHARRKLYLAWPKPARTSSGCWGCGTSFRTPRSSLKSTLPNSAPEQPSSQARRPGRSAQSSWREGRSKSPARMTRTARQCCTSGSASTSSRPATRTQGSPRSSELSSCAGGPPSPVRAYSLASLAGGLMVDWRYSESLPISEDALALARRVEHARRRSGRLPSSPRSGLSRPRRGRVAHFRHALKLAEEIGDLIGLDRAHVNFVDALTMLGRTRESVRLGRAGIEVMRRYGVDSTLLVSNLIAAAARDRRMGRGRRAHAAELRGISSSHPDMPLMIRAILQTGRGAFAQARAHLDAARAVLHRTAIWRCTTASRRARHLGPPLVRRRRGRARRVGADEFSRVRPDTGPALRLGAPRPGRAGSIRACPPRPRRRSTLARSGTQTYSHCPRRRRGGLSDHTQGRRLARPGRGRVRPCAGRRTARSMVGRRSDVAAA